MARRDAVSPDRLQPDASTNLALWLDRYTWGFDQEILRTHLISTLASVRVPEGYDRAFERRKKAVRDGSGGYADGETRLCTISLQGRAVLGIGMASVRETNLTLLRPWGIPYLAGSSLKGLASHVAHDSGKAPWARPEKPGEKAGEWQRALFGDVTGAGAVIFHDAWWIPAGDRLPVHHDTMTAHHANYYGGKAEAPADWQEPNPVGFLTITGKYLLALSGPPEALDLVEQLLSEGLQNKGIGAKTAAGYGRASIERLLSEVVKKMDAFQRPAAQPSTVEHLTREFLTMVAEASQPDEISAARRAARRMIDANPKVWRDWLQKERCPEEARGWFTIEPEKPATVAPLTAPPAAVSVPVTATEAPADEQQATAWIAPDKNKRPTLYVLLPGTKKPLEEELRKLKRAPDDATQAALATASADTPCRVLVELKGGKRVLGVRLAT